MVDFLKANPFMSMDEYLWGRSIPMIRLMGLDNSHVNYLTEKQAQNRNIQDVDFSTADINKLNTDLGTKVVF